VGSKYDRYDKPKIKTKDQKMHPIWRGIGCLMLILIPVMGYAAADVFLQAAPGWGLFPRSSDLYQNIDLQYIILPFSIGQVVFTIFFAVVGFLLFSLVYAFVFRVAGPPRYGPTDAPPPKRGKKRRR
jgi:hypothetical protein